MPVQRLPWDTRFGAQFGDLRLRLAHRRLLETPDKATVRFSVLGSLMRHAIRIGARDDNPASEMPILKIGEHEPWPADMLRVCLEEATPMTRLAIVTGLCSGQRIGDCVRMQYGRVKDGIMEFTQQKIRLVGIVRDVAVLMHPFWLEELAKLPRRSITLLYERSGAPFKATAAIQERLRALMAQPAVREVHADLVAREMIAEDATFTFHGLRKNACCYLLERRPNDSEVGEMLGMSPEIVRHYGKRAKALMIARGAVERMTGGKRSCRSSEEWLISANGDPYGRDVTVAKSPEYWAFCVSRSATLYLLAVPTRLRP